ncbi:MAG: type II toxin-antitoxin system HicB family antitoxin [Rhodospirillales bacterium]|jgi:antitoxin HicB|nr:hypothetical protein [Rhodospirillaceae bacterium]MDP6427781.1 type II toxin-antitoxin system HicB family antitoxin [Rhodospirillales bacterium]MDP6644585.1 type II toxin-antitoxin system HicB family antitoxin [Rhodospirillales bacterium]|tara:strand:- start:1309 stop:1749 length:441 start_codon:yes stop_codon:yes gene_type:complete
MTTISLAYPAKLTEDEDGRFVVSFPDFGWGATDGATRDEALEEAQDCLEEMIAGLLVEGEALPKPSPARGRSLVRPGVLIAAKAALNQAFRESGTTRVALAKALGVGEAEVRRMLSPRHKTKITRLEDALAILGKRLELSVADAAA